jgi:hypothetical protein
MTRKSPSIEAWLQLTSKWVKLGHWEMRVASWSMNFWVRFPKPKWSIHIFRRLKREPIRREGFPQSITRITNSFRGRIFEDSKIWSWIHRGSWSPTIDLPEYEYIQVAKHCHKAGTHTMRSTFLHDWTAALRYLCSTISIGLSTFAGSSRGKDNVKSKVRDFAKRLAKHSPWDSDFSWAGRRRNWVLKPPMLRCESSWGCTRLQNWRDTKESVERLAPFGGCWAYRGKW